MPIMRGGGYEEQDAPQVEETLPGRSIYNANPVQNNSIDERHEMDNAMDNDDDNNNSEDKENSHPNSFRNASSQSRTRQPLRPQAQPAYISAFSSYVASLLHTHNMALHPIEPDGNCLFRAVSHQIYGTQSYHAEVRRFVVQYLRIEEEYFKNFIPSSYRLYLETIARDGVWGDDVEVEVLSEMYGVRIEVFGFARLAGGGIGARRLRTFHENDGGGGDSGGRVMRLSYGGGGHYDSLIESSSSSSSSSRCRLPRNTTVGTIEQRALRAASDRRDSDFKSHEGNTQREDELLRRAVEESRREFEEEEGRSNNDIDAFENGDSGYVRKRTSDLDMAISESLAEFEQMQLAAAENSDLQTVLATSVTQQQTSASSEIETTMIDNAKMLGDEEEDIRMAMELSAKEVGSSVTPVDDVARAIELSMAQTLSDENTASLGVGMGFGMGMGMGMKTGMGADFYLDEDEEMRKAMEISKNESSGISGDDYCQGDIGIFSGEDREEDDPLLLIALSESKKTG